MDAGALIKKYIELRDRIDEISKRHSEELSPLSDAMRTIENALMHQMNITGVTQLKAAGIGTAFQKVSNSTQMADPEAFKKFVFTPVIEAIAQYLYTQGVGLRPDDVGHISTLIGTMPRWDMVDFRAGKKGVVEYVTNEQQPVPGVNVNSIASISIRRD